MTTIVKMPMKGFAEIAAAKPSSKAGKLRKYKYPKSGGSIGRSNYYVRAIAAIKHHHKGHFAMVKATLQELAAEIAVEQDQRKRTQAMHNHRAITEYLKAFGTRKLTVVQGKRLSYVHKNLVVSAYPDLVAQEEGNLLLIKLHFCKDDLPGGVCPIMLHILYEAAQVQGLPVKSNGVECVQTSSGTKVTGPKNGFPSKAVLNAACEEVLTLWPAA